MDNFAPQTDADDGHHEPTLEVSINPRVSFTQWQNRVPILESLEVIGAKNRSYGALQLSLACEPALIHPRTWVLDSLPAQSRLIVADRDLALAPERLRELSANLRLIITLTLTSSAGVVALKHLALEALPHDHWSGCAHHPALVAAFVQPKDPATVRLAQRTAQLLQESHRPQALSGYRHGATQVWYILEAAWGAVTELGLSYVAPPPNFELQGQKVRSVQQVVEHRLATCLDTTLLFAGIMEFFGLKPVPLFIEGHALVAVWLRPTQFDQPVICDLATVRNRLAIRDLVAFETTLTTLQPPSSFLEATQRAAATLSHLEGNTLVAAIDVAQARQQGILPLTDDISELPRKAHVSGTGNLPAQGAQVPSWLPDDVSATGSWPQALKKASPRERRLAEWKNDLLDLTLKNSLLNVKDTKSCISIVCSDPGKLEDALVQGKKFRLLAMPDLAARIGLGARQNPEETLLEELALADKELSQGTALYCRLDAQDLDARLIHLYRKCRTLQQEGDSNVLFLAIGSLVWRYDNEHKSHAAPLLLVPVVLNPKDGSKPFVLRLHEDDPRFNPTLVELLRVKFNLRLPLDVENLPQNQNGLDVHAILRAVGSAVRDQPGWEVKFDVRLSIFSFTRFLLWRDLEERADLLDRSPIVDHLLNRPLEPFVEVAKFPLASSLDTTLEPEHVLCPLPADSSQMVAIQAAIAGKSFIIIGPPGTGKSQTIANIIAQCLAKKNRVLFVSAKAEALNVVYRRLQEVGLGDFCLSMHSHKDAQADVIEQLRQAWTDGPEPNDDAWERQAARASTARHKLNSYAVALHAKSRNGLTPYRAMAQTLATPNVPRVSLRWDHPDMHDNKAREALRDVAEHLGHAASECHGLLHTPLTCVTHHMYSRAWQQRLVEAAEQVVRDATHVTAAFAPLAALSGQAPEDLTLHMAAARLPLWRQIAETRSVFGASPSEELPAVAQHLAAAAALLEQYRAARLGLLPACSEEACLQLERGRTLVVAYREQWAHMSASYTPTIAAFDAAQAQLMWQQSKHRWWFGKMRQQAAVRASMRAHQQGDLPRAETEAELGRLVELQKRATAVDALEVSGPFKEMWLGVDTDLECLEASLALHRKPLGQPLSPQVVHLIASGRCGATQAAMLRAHNVYDALTQHLSQRADLAHMAPTVWRGPETDPQALLQLQREAHNLAQVAAAVLPEPQARTAALQALWPLLPKANHPSAQLPRHTFIAHLEAFCRAHAEAQVSFAAFCALLKGDVAPAPAEAPSWQLTPIAALAERARGVAALHAKLPIWCRWLRACADARDHNLSALVDAVMSAQVAPEQVLACFDASYAKWWVEAAFDRCESLQNFIASDQNKAVSDFQAADDYLTAEAAGRIRAALRKDLPARESVASSSAWGRLNHELGKKKDFMVLRKLLQVAGPAVHALAPCFMMSPLSVAQYLPLDEALFDVVIFDEASQIRVSEAIGAMARGKQVIMVGDPKQMPPTDFFGSALELEDETADDEDDSLGLQESILDLCRAARLPQHILRWHYRSRHESLIAFSNAQYYDHELVTFCSADNKRKAVSFHFVKGGTWQSGKARRNAQEARALVAHIVQGITDGTFSQHEHTVGIIAFNLNQARFIEDLLDIEGQKSTRVAAAIAPNGPLHLFVKNLESVQGDERDIIYISIAYAQERGKTAVPIRFGPLNNQGGERRLNVAVSRSRYAMRVFSSIRAEQLPEAKLKSQGVKDFKRFLSYAERGPDALAHAESQPVANGDSSFEALVAESLTSLGWQVERHIGVGSFRVDLGILDPDGGGSYVAGVECDGATYHSSATARDRDKIRARVLKSLGWRLVRIWSTDWWLDPEAAAQRAHEQLEGFVARARAAREEAAAAILAVTQPATHELPGVPPDQGKSGPHAGGDAEPESQAAHTPRQHPADRLAALCAVQSFVREASRFFEANYAPTLQSLVAHILAAEAPMAEAALAQRVARLHGFKRTGAKIADHVGRVALHVAYIVQEIDGKRFWWLTMADGSGPHRVPFRWPVSGSASRAIEDISLYELASLAQLAQRPKATREDVLGEMARGIGLEKLSVSSRARLLLAAQQSHPIGR